MSEVLSVAQSSMGLQEPLEHLPVANMQQGPVTCKSGQRKHFECAHLKEGRPWGSRRARKKRLQATIPPPRQQVVSAQLGRT